MYILRKNKKSVRIIYSYINLRKVNCVSQNKTLANKFYNAENKMRYITIIISSCCNYVIIITKMLCVIIFYYKLINMIKICIHGLAVYDKHVAHVSFSGNKGIK